LSLTQEIVFDLLCVFNGSLTFATTIRYKTYRSCQKCEFLSPHAFLITGRHCVYNEPQVKVMYSYNYAESNRK